MTLRPCGLFYGNIIYMNHTTATDLIMLSNHEWLESNGSGAYASSTIADCHTRRYHGLLVAPVIGTEGRHVLLSQLEAIIYTPDNSYSLATNYYPGAVHPQGYQYICEWDFDPCPTLVYNLNGMRIRREIFMADKECAVYIRYLLEGPIEEVQIQLKPLLSYRDAHGLSSENMCINTQAHRLNKGICLTPYHDMPPLYLQYNQELNYYPGPCWEKQVELPLEIQRGFDAHEDRFFPGILEGTLVKGVPLLIRAGTENNGFVQPAIYQHQLHQRTRNINDAHHPHLSCLRRHADCFFTENTQGEHGIIAGYPWFGVWGRDTMLSLPGLCFSNDQQARGLDILRSCAHHLKNGLLPNTFAGLQGTEAFNSIDASLLLCWSLQMYVENADDAGSKNIFMREFFPMLEHIIQAFISNSVPIAHMDEHGLISSGDANTQYTWMDARAYGKPVTPRYGYAVEINALWYNALTWYVALCKSHKKIPVTDANSLDVSSLAKNLKKHFRDMFWLDDKKYCADVVNEHGHDTSLRPNQLFAASLPNSPLTKVQQRSLLSAIDRELLTPYGLRTLSPQHPDYCGHYTGSPDERDASYHQGTVWPWLIGPYVDAHLRCSKNIQRCGAQLHQQFKSLFTDHIYTDGLGGIAEIFDGDHPHQAKGCFTQAWSVAEAIRAQTLIQKALNS